VLPFELGAASSLNNWTDRRFKHAGRIQLSARFIFFHGRRESRHRRAGLKPSSRRAHIVSGDLEQVLGRRCTTAPVIRRTARDTTPCLYSTSTATSSISPGGAIGWTVPGQHRCAWKPGVRPRRGPGRVRQRLPDCRRYSRADRRIHAHAGAREHQPAVLPHLACTSRITPNGKHLLVTTKGLQHGRRV
jgi:hypothetical protein